MQPASTSPASFIEKLGGEALDIVIAEGEAQEPALLADIDALLKTGEHNLEQAVTKAFTAKIPLVGAAVGSAINTALEGVEAPAENAAKFGYDAALAALTAEATKLGG